MTRRKIGSLFSGIGGLELGLERAGLGETVWQVEQDDWCRGILAKNYPNTRRYIDVRDVGVKNLERVDVIVGGFPCQDVSVAGKGGGVEDGTRSGLWSEYARIVEELRPSLVIIENVPGLRGRGLRRVLADLAGLGLDALWTTLGAWEVGAPHKRDRLFIIAADPDRLELRDVAERIEARRLDVRRRWEAVARHDGASRDASDAQGVGGGAELHDEHACDGGEDCGWERDALALRDRRDDPDADRVGRTRRSGDGQGGTGLAEPPECDAAPHGHGHGRESVAASRLHADRALGNDVAGRYGPAIARWEGILGRRVPRSVVRRVDDGLSGELVDQPERLGALGNAVVPQQAELIGAAIVDVLDGREG